MTTDELSLAATIRVWRDRLTPSAVGLPEKRARRAPGLRREDLAELAGVSVDYVVRLEQGRSTAPSSQVVAALARALQLSSEERDHLYRLAGLQPPAPGTVDGHIPPGILRVLNRLGDTPAGVFAADWSLLWSNRGWASLLGNPLELPPGRRNCVRALFPVGDEDTPLAGWPVRSLDQETTDRAVVADLRRATARFPADGALAELVRRTLAGNERFAQLWREGGVGRHTEDHKVVHHPVVGPIAVECNVLVDTDSELKVVTYAAETADDENRLRLALVAGDHAPGAAVVNA